MAGNCNAAEDMYTLQLRCTRIVPASGSWPRARSAHSLVAGPDGTLVLLCGDTGEACQRFSDLWLLPNPGGSHVTTWQQVSSGAAGSCTARSNSTVAVAGEWLLLFGGWDWTGTQPLAHLEGFNIRTRTWQTPTVSGQSPSPRGQPAAAADTAGNTVYFLGGWDGKQRYNDLHRLHIVSMSAWHWELVPPFGQQLPAAQSGSGVNGERQSNEKNPCIQVMADATAPAAPAAAADGSVRTAVMPCPRADHVMVCWHYCDDGTWKDILVVFGGSSTAGLLNDTWLFDVNSSRWTQAYCGGAAPCPRSSSAAAITGDIFLLHGGQTQAAVLQDMYLLQLSNLTWLQIDLGPVLQPLCRHSMAVAADACWIFGGYDGAQCHNQLLTINLQPVLQLQKSSVEELTSKMACCGGVCADESNGAGTSDGYIASQAVESSTQQQQHQQHSIQNGTNLAPSVMRVLNKKATPSPLKLTDLPDAGSLVTLPQWKQIRLLHQAALAAGADMYIDPKTGYSVFTAHYLQKRQCCGNKCRHCPHGWRNVAQPASSNIVAAATATDC